jgi:hypothetical protein
VNLEHNNGFFTQFHDVVSGTFKNNREVTVKYYVLKPDTPQFVLQFLLLSLNATAKTTCTSSGVWEFVAMYK